ncbi:MAG: hypothetical protein QM658_10565 [Gordonia sp. (in: high G+C Gram-positive bacteria)]
MTFEIPCRTGFDDDSATRHEITVNPDWSFETPHDFLVESVAAALGARCSCLDLAAVIKAVRLHSALNLRRTWYPLIQLTACEWRSRGSSRSWPSVLLAAAHIRSPSHAAEAHAVEAWQVEAITQHLDWAHWHDRPHPDHIFDGSVGLFDEFCFSEFDGTETLWEAGIRPEYLPTVFGKAGVERLSPAQAVSIAYLHIAPKQLRAAIATTGDVDEALTKLLANPHYCR